MISLAGTQCTELRRCVPVYLFLTGLYVHSELLGQCRQSVCQLNQKKITGTHCFKESKTLLASTIILFEDTSCFYLPFRK